MLYLLYHQVAQSDSQAEQMVRETLDRMAISGLRDHLAGGFFRYCVDREWQIPHFEKMLYDQALLLWIYSLAYQLFQDDHYRQIAEGIIKNLQNEFYEQGLYFSGIDADTNHVEGQTYVWDYEKLEQILSDKELAQLKERYEIQPQGNFQGKIHLIRKGRGGLPEIEGKLFAYRRKRSQPDVDRKIISSWNALLGIAYLQTYRYLGEESYLTAAHEIYAQLLDQHYNQAQLVHSSCEQQIQEQEFLEDYAAFLLLMTYLYEEQKIETQALHTWREKLMRFKEDSWIANQTIDFFKIPAGERDNPLPAPVSTAEFALLRSQILLDESFSKAAFKQPLSHDFYNLYAFWSQAYGHLIHTPQKLQWTDIPLHSMQIPADSFQDCYKGRCAAELITD